jgi:hypothetical protein
MSEKRTVNMGINKGKMGRPPPPWLYELKDGIYTVKELMNFSKKSNPNVRNLMYKYATKVTHSIQQNGRSLAHYHWEHKHFLKITEGEENKNEK